MGNPHTLLMSNIIRHLELMSPLRFTLAVTSQRHLTAAVMLLRADINQHISFLHSVQHGISTTDNCKAEPV